MTQRSFGTWIAGTESLAGRFFLLASAWLLSVLALSVSVHAQERPRHRFTTDDLWSEPNPGLRYLRRSTNIPCVIHLIEVDLDADGVEIRATPHDERWQTVSSFAADGGYAAALNGGFWGSLSRPLGAHVSDGVAWPETGDNALFGFFAIDHRGRARISPPREVVDPLPPLRQAVSGRPLLVDHGEVTTDRIDPMGGANYLQPRSAVGVSRDGRKVWFLVTDGRQETSRGLTLYQLARTLKEFGAWRAMNLDGGGSSTMYVRRMGGVVNAPSSNRWQAHLGLGAKVVKRRTRNGREQLFVRGVEREVMSHLAIVAPDSALPMASARWDDDLPIVLPPSPPPLAVGKWRERVVPISATVGAVFLALMLAWIAKRYPNLLFLARRRDRRRT